jgi:regulatory protein YycI of two-component signal transduction system YycFG
VKGGKYDWLMKDVLLVKFYQWFEGFVILNSSAAVLILFKGLPLGNSKK